MSVFPRGSQEEIKNRFTYHPPTTCQVVRYTEIRGKAENLALYLDEHCPDSRELSMALARLEEMVMWANAAIARNE